MRMQRILRWMWILVWLPIAVQAAPRNEIAVTGSVTALDGVGLSGVHVEIMPFLDDYRAGQHVLAGRLEAEAAATTRTNDAGRFELRAPAPGLWRVVVRSPGHVPMHFPTLALVAATELPRVALQPDRGLRLRVTDASGGPAADVWVWAQTQNDALWSASAVTDWAPAFRAFRTDENGTVRLPAADSEELDVTVLANQGEARKSTTSEELTVRIEKHAVWRWIEVRDAQQRPVSDILVRGGPLAWPLGLTGDDGRLRIPIRGRESSIRLVTPAGDRQEVEVPLAAEGSDDLFVVELRPPTTLAGRVLEHGSRRAVPGALVWAGIDPGLFVRTDQQGRYQLRAPVADRFWIQAEAPGLVAEAVWLSRQELAVNRVPSLALQPATDVRGRVVDPSGAAVRGASLAAVERPPTRANYFRSGGAARRSHSAADGRFELPGLAHGGSYEIEVSRPGWTATAVRLVMPAVADRPSPLTVVLTPQRAAHGRVVDAEDRPLAGVEVTAAPAGRAPLVPLPADDSRLARTDSEGRFRVARLPASEVDLEFVKQGFAPMKLRGLEVTLGEASEPIDLGTVIMAAGADMTGRVVDEDGESLSGASIHVVRSERPQRPGGVAEQWLLSLPPEARSDGEGQFRLGQLTPGERIHLLVGADGHSPVWVENLEVPTGEAMHVVMRRAAGVAGRVVDDEGEPVSGAEMVFEQRHDQQNHGAVVRQMLTASDGSFHFDGLRAMPGRLTAFSPGFVPPPPMMIEVTADEPVDDLEIRLERGASIAGRAVTSGGEPVAGVKIFAGRPAAVSDADGVFHLDGLSLGPTQVEARHPHYGRRLENVDVTPGVNTLEFLFEDGHEVLGRVLDDSGAPVADASVEIVSRRGSERRGHQAWSAADGGFRFEPVVDGVYDLRAKRQEYATAEVEAGLRVAGRSVAGLEIRLERGVEIHGEILGLEFDELARVRVEATDAAGGLWAGEIDYQGHYVISDLRPGEWSVRAALTGGAREARARLNLTSGAGSVRQDLEFRPGLILSGQVLHNGEPLAATTVSLEPLASGTSRQVRSDPLGRFRIEDLESGSYRLGVMHVGEQLTDHRLVELDGHRDLIFDLRSARIGGRLLGLGGSQPIAGAVIALRPLSQDAAATGIRTAGSDSAGHFLLPRIPEGRYQMQVAKDGGVLEERELDVRGGVDALELEIILEEPLSR